MHDFPIRDEILIQFLPFTSGLDVLEVGPGSGFTAFRLLPAVRHLSLLDVCAGPLEWLRAQFQDAPWISCRVADMARPGLSSVLGRQYDAVFALDVFEYVSDPEAALRNLCQVLRPGGELLLTFPNTPPPDGDSVNWFTSIAEIERLLDVAGFLSWEVFAVRLGWWARLVLLLLHDIPLAAWRSLRRGEQLRSPPTYEATWAFRRGRRLDCYKVPLHFYWALLHCLLALGGPAFRVEPCAGGIVGKQLVIRCRG